MPGVISEEAAAALRSDWEKKFKGSKNAGKLAILDGAMDWVKTGMDNSDAQYLETRRYQNAEIWRIFRVPPHIVGDLDKATFSNIEQLSLEYVRYCLSTEFKRWTDALKRELLLDAEKPKFDFVFDEDSLLRGDMLSRYQAIAQGRNWGVLSANEARSSLGLNPVPNGDVYLQPLNMVEAGSPPPQPAAPPAPPSDPAKIVEPIRPNGHANGAGASA
jgi:HK97 family phage portal protein